MAAYLNRELELAFAQLAVAPQWNTGSEGALEKALQRRDRAIDNAIGYARATGRRLEDVIYIPS